MTKLNSEKSGAMNLCRNREQAKSIYKISAYLNIEKSGTDLNLDICFLVEAAELIM